MTKLVKPKESFILFLFFLSAFIQSLIISMLGPLFPSEAESKGMTPYQYGLINSLPSLVCFILSPIAGHYIDRIGLQRVFVWGTLLNGLVPIGIGVSDYFTDFKIFLIFTILIRSLMGALNVAIVCSKYSPCFTAFPDRPSTAVGISESGFLSGTCIGPMIATGLSTLVGYSLAFISMGLLQAFLGLILMLFLPQIRVPPSESMSLRETMNSYRHVFSKNNFLIIFVLGMFLAEMGFGYVNTILEPGMRIFNLTINQVGLMFFAKGVCQILAPFWGMVLDYVTIPNVIYATGFVTSALGIFIFSPLPFIPEIPVVTVVGLLLYGLGQGILDIGCICCFQMEFLNLAEPGIGQGSQSIVTVIYLMAAASGGFAGAGISGALLQFTGFPSAMLFMGGINLAFGIFLFVYIFLKYFTSSSNGFRQSDESSPLLTSPESRSGNI